MVWFRQVVISIAASIHVVEITIVLCLLYAHTMMQDIISNSVRSAPYAISLPLSKPYRAVERRTSWYVCLRWIDYFIQ